MRFPGRKIPLPLPRFQMRKSPRKIHLEADENYRYPFCDPEWYPGSNVVDLPTFTRIVWVLGKAHDRVLCRKCTKLWGER